MHARMVRCQELSGGNNARRSYLAHSEVDELLLVVHAEAMRVGSEKVLAVTAANFRANSLEAVECIRTGTNGVLAVGADELVGEAYFRLRLDKASGDVHLPTENTTY